MQQAVQKPTKQAILAWCFYDWASSSFSTVVATFVFATYFTSVVAVNKVVGTSQWGNANALAALIIAVFSPILGSIADYGGRPKIWLGIFTIITIIATAALWFAYPVHDQAYYMLTCIVIGMVGFEFGTVFYNSTLADIAPKGYLGRISGWAWGLGYIGGLVCLTIVLLAFVEGKAAWLHTATAANVRIAGPFSAAWFLIFALPFFFLVRDRPATGIGLLQSIKCGLREAIKTVKTLPQQKNISLYLIARMIYIDGLNTIFAFGGIYAAGTFGMDIAGVLKFGIAMNIAAGTGAIALAWTDDYFGSKRTILVALCGIILFAFGVLFAQTETEFVTFAMCISLFVGPAQAASRSLMARILPEGKANEYFGLYAFSGRITSFMGPWILALVTLHFNSQRLGMSTILLFLIVGFILLLRVSENR